MKMMRFMQLLALCGLLQISLSKRNEIIVLNEDNWREGLDGEWMIKFYAPWCPACKANEADYATFAEWSDDLNIKVAMVDITKEPGLSGRFMVTALPTFYHGKDGEFRRYNNARTSDAMHEFIESKSWKGVEPIWWMRHPNSILMTLMSWLFKTSIIMKNIHEVLTESYGLSTWMSYAVFGVGTLLTGLTLGLLLVCVVDIISPPKNERRESSTYHVPRDVIDEEDKKRNEKRSRETEDDEEDEDDHSQVSQTSSRASQEWETIHDVEIDDAEPSEGSQLRQRKSTNPKPEISEEGGDAPIISSENDNNK